MKKAFFPSTAFGAITLLSACGGGGGTISLQDFASINASTDISEFTDNAVVNASTDTLSYSGFVNIGPDTRPSSELVGFVGNLDLDVNFALDTITGDATNFGRYTSVSATGNLPAVSGSLDIDGTLTGTNETLSDGLVGTAVGTVDGYDFNMTMDGNILGQPSRGGVVLYFDNIGDLGGGVGIAVR